MSAFLAVVPQFEELRPLLARHFPAPYQFHCSLASEGALQNLAERRARRLLSSESAFPLVFRRRGVVSAAACWSKLPWESGQPGFPDARLDFLLAEGDYFGSRKKKCALLADLLEDCCKLGVRHLGARVEAGDLSTIHALEGAGFELIDGIQTFAFSLDGPAPEPQAKGIEIRLFREADLGQVLEIARAARMFDRFHADPTLRLETADRINEVWLRNSCVGHMADAVMVACQGADVLGYVTCKVDMEAAGAFGSPLGNIVMAVTAEAVRRRGIGTAAVLGALVWFREKEVRLVEASAQMRNIAAGRLYERCGFRLCAARLAFRKLFG